MKKLLAILIIFIFIIVAPFFIAYSNGASIIESLIFIPMSILASTLGGFIGIFCLKLLKIY